MLGIHHRKLQQGRGKFVQRPRKAIGEWRVPCGSVCKCIPRADCAETVRSENDHSPSSDPGREARVAKGADLNLAAIRGKAEAFEMKPDVTLVAGDHRTLATLAVKVGGVVVMASTAAPHYPPRFGVLHVAVIEVHLPSAARLDLWPRRPRAKLFVNCAVVIRQPCPHTASTPRVVHAQSCQMSPVNN